MEGKRREGRFWEKKTDEKIKITEKTKESEINKKCEMDEISEIDEIETKKENNQVTNDNWPVWPCLKLVIIWGTRAKTAETVPIIGRIDKYYEY